MTKQGSPTILWDGPFVNIEFHPSDSVEVIELLKSRIRRLTYYDVSLESNNDLYHMSRSNGKIFLEISILSRIGLSLSRDNKIVNISDEELVFLQNLNLNPRTQFLADSLIKIGLSSTSLWSGKSDPVEADRIHKTIAAVMAD